MQRAPNPDSPSAETVLAAYRLLRLSRDEWRRLLADMATPLRRLHRYRDASERAWQTAVRHSDRAAECGAGHDR
jgi:hypothetical protein